MLALEVETAADHCFGEGLRQPAQVLPISVLQNPGDDEPGSRRGEPIGLRVVVEESLEWPGQIVGHGRLFSVEGSQQQVAQGLDEDDRQNG